MQKGIGVRFLVFYIAFLFTSSNFIPPIFQKETFLPAQKSKKHKHKHKQQNRAG